MLSQLAASSLKCNQNHSTGKCITRKQSSVNDNKINQNTGSISQTLAAQKLDSIKFTMCEVTIPIGYTWDAKTLSLTLFAPNNPAFIIPLALMAHH